MTSNHSAPIPVRLDDPELVPFVGLTDVQARTLNEPAQGIYIAEGLKVVQRALRAGHRPLRALCTPRWLEGMHQVLPTQTPIHVADEETVRTLTGYRVHRGALVAFARPADPGTATLATEARRLVLLEELKEHTNVGAVVRSAAAFGVDGLIVSPGCADPLYRRAVKVSMGTVFDLPWARSEHWATDLELLRELGFTLAALTPDPAAVDLRDLAGEAPERLAWMLGTEGPGLSAETLEQCSLRVRIPMQPGVDSLNVAAAAAVAFFAVP
jgi:tRNA G18 (ribose-2'-O)-methylase SpoU